MLLKPPTTVVVLAVLLVAPSHGGAMSGGMDVGSPAPATTAAGAPNRTAETGRKAGPSRQATELRIRQLIAQLDAPDFQSRRQATRGLRALGTPAIPFLVDALGSPACELRQRAGVLLREHEPLEEVAWHLVAAVETDYGTRARAILYEQAARQIAGACQPRHAATFFKLRGTSGEAFRGRSLTRLMEVKTRAQAARAIQPLLGLRDRTASFDDFISRLESLSLSYGHQHSPGFVIAKTLARDSGRDRSAPVEFAWQYLESFESLALQLRRRGRSAHAIRKEIAERASMSQGAAAYLLQILDDTSAQTAVLRKRIGIEPVQLRQAFCRGVAAPVAKDCYREVGKVHIAEMASDLLQQWPDAPADGLVRKLVVDIRQTASVGDKPKALALLDALEACRELPEHGLNVRSGLGQRLARRLQIAAENAPNNRVYYPARIVHNTIVKLIDRGVSPSQPTFPHAALDDYLRGSARAVSDPRRLALSRYLRLLQRLRAAGLGLELPGVMRFTITMRDQVTTGHGLLAEGVAEVDRLLQEHRADDGEVDRVVIDRALAAWCRGLDVPPPVRMARESS